MRPKSAFFWTALLLLYLYQLALTTDDYPVFYDTLSTICTNSIESVDHTSECIVVSCGHKLGIHCRRFANLESTGNFSSRYILRAVVISKDNSIVVVGGTKPQLQPVSMLFVYRLNQREYELVQNISLEGRLEVMEVDISNDNSKIAVGLGGTGQGLVSVWTSAGTEFTLGGNFKAYELSLWALSMQSPGFIITGGSDGPAKGHLVKVWRYNQKNSSYQLNQPLLCNDQINDIDFSSTETYIAAGLSSGDVVIFKRGRTGFEKDQTIVYHNLQVTSVRFNIVASRLAVSAYNEKKLTFWAHSKSTNSFVLRTEDKVETYALAFDINFLVNCPRNGVNCTVYTLQLNCSSDPHSDGKNVGNESCSCVPPYNWNKITVSCLLNCSSQKNALPSPNLDGKCNCIAGYYWKDYYCYLNCSAIANTVSNADAASCVCLRGYVWKNDRCWVDCSVIENSQKNIDMLTCSCVRGYDWVDGRCKRNCAGDPFANGNKNNTTCNCLPSYVWRQDSCVLRCRIVNYTKECLCDDGLDWRQDRCWLTCSKIDNTLGKNDGPNRCKCKQNFIWSAGKCWLNCTSISYTTGVSKKPSSCNCASNFVWNSTNSECWRDCSIVLESNGHNTGQTTCQCINGYIWNSRMAQCEIDCRLIEHSTRAPPENRTACECKPGFYWYKGRCQERCIYNFPSDRNFDSAACRCNQNFTLHADGCWRDCSVILHSTETNKGKTGCECKPPYAWAFEKCALNCSLVAFSSSTDINSTGCQCEPGFYFSVEKESCIVNCTGIPFSTQSIVSVDKGECGCTNSYLWEDKHCHRNCNIIGSNGRKTNTEQCICIDKFQWNDLTGVCEIQCSIVLEGLSSDILKQPTNTTRLSPGVCPCPQNYHWNETQLECQLDCKPGKYSTGRNIDALNCQCLPGFAFKFDGCELDCQKIHYSTGSSTSDGGCSCHVLLDWDRSVRGCRLSTVGLGIVALAAVILLSLIVASAFCLWKCIKRRREQELKDWQLNRYQLPGEVFVEEKAPSKDKEISGKLPDNGLVQDKQKLGGFIRNQEQSAYKIRPEIAKDDETDKPQLNRPNNNILDCKLYTVNQKWRFKERIPSKRKRRLN